MSFKVNLFKRCDSLKNFSSFPLRLCNIEQKLDSSASNPSFALTLKLILRLKTCKNISKFSLEKINAKTFHELRFSAHPEKEFLKK